MPSLLTCAEMHADHIVSSGSPHNNVLHFSSDIHDYLYLAVLYTYCTLKLRAAWPAPTHMFVNIDTTTSSPQGHE